MAKKKPKQVIGRADLVDLPELGVQEVNAKIDTGAYRSSIHCKKVYLKGDTLLFVVYTEEGWKEFETTKWKQRVIRSSNGKKQERFVITTTIRLFEKNYKASISLTDRSKMKSPLLIGRKLIKDRFLVDVSAINLSYQHKLAQCQEKR